MTITRCDINVRDIMLSCDVHTPVISRSSEFSVIEILSVGCVIYQIFVRGVVHA